MPFEILRQDITKMDVDAIVNSTSSHPSINGSADRMVHEAAGKSLLEARKAFGFLEPTKAVITKGYALNTGMSFML